MASKAGNFGYRLYVSNLPWTVANRQLKEYFSQFGHVAKAVVIFDKSNGMSKGYGFVTFSTGKSINAIQNKTTHLLEGHTLNIGTFDPPKQID